MFLVGIISWWYGRGWRGQLLRIRERLTVTVETFSIGQLFMTLFAPFRQISAGKTNGSVGDQLRAFFDTTISRVIGAIVRSFTIIAGIMTLTIQVISELIVSVIWLVLPLFPIVGLILFAIGWVPRWI